LNKLECADLQRSPGKRVFSSIKDARSAVAPLQTNSVSRSPLLYDNIYDNRAPDGYCPWSKQVSAASRHSGWNVWSPVVRFWLDPDQKPVNATDSQLTETERLYIGAVAVLKEATGKTPIQIDFFHNPFTTKPRWLKYFPHSNDRHFVKPGPSDTMGWD
jgi:hypothetical protein